MFVRTNFIPTAVDGSVPISVTADKAGPYQDGPEPHTYSAVDLDPSNPVGKRVRWSTLGANFKEKSRTVTTIRPFNTLIQAFSTCCTRS